MTRLMFKCDTERNKIQVHSEIQKLKGSYIHFHVCKDLLLYLKLAHSSKSHGSSNLILVFLLGVDMWLVNCLVDKIGHVFVNINHKQSSNDGNASERETAQVYNFEGV